MDEKCTKTFNVPRLRGRIAVQGKFNRILVSTFTKQITKKTKRDTLNDKYIVRELFTHASSSG